MGALVPRKAVKEKATKRKATRSRKLPEGSKKIMLSLSDRLYLGEILPDRESRATMKLRRKLIERISLTAAEVKSIDYQESPDGRLRQWNLKKASRKKGVTFGAFELEMIVAGFEKADAAKTLSDSLLDLMDIFVPEAKE